MKEIILEFLKEMIPTIEMIDGGCKNCISEYCDSTNDILLAYNLKLEVSDDYPIKVTIKEL